MIFRDSEKAFKNAKQCGLEVEDYMYMYSDNEKDYFKNIFTRQYTWVFYKEELKDDFSL